MKPVFTAMHYSEGDGPNIENNKQECYYGYYETSDGDQAVFVYDYKERKGGLRMSALGWENLYEVDGGKPVGIEVEIPVQFWLAACWAQATKFFGTPQMFDGAQ